MKNMVEVIKQKFTARLTGTILGLARLQFTPMIVSLSYDSLSIHNDLRVPTNSRNLTRLFVTFTFINWVLGGFQSNSILIEFISFELYRPLKSIYMLQRHNNCSLYLERKTTQHHNSNLQSYMN